MRAPADRRQLERFLDAMARAVQTPLRLYLVGGSVLVDLGLCGATLGIDYVVSSEDPAALAQFERQLPKLKDQLDVNVEPASPSDFMPVPSGVLDRSRYVRNYGMISLYHYHYPSLVIGQSRSQRGARSRRYRAPAELGSCELGSGRAGVGGGAGQRDRLAAPHTR